MQMNQMTDKKVVYVDGEQWGDVIAVGESFSEKDTVEAADGNFKRTLSNGQKSITTREITFAIDRESPIKEKCYSWYDNNEVHDVTIVSVDGHGDEFERELLTDCELSKTSRPAWEATSALQAKIMIIVVPYNSQILNA